MLIAVLGAAALGGGARPLTALRGPRSVALLSTLATAPRRRLDRELLVEALWPRQRVSDATLRVTVNRLRSQLVQTLGQDLIVSDRMGVMLDLPAGELDAEMYDHLRGRAAAAWVRGRAAETVKLLDEAEALWRGEPYSGVEVDLVAMDRDRLELLRSEVWENHAAALTVCGDLDRAATMLEGLVRQHPYRERAWALLLTARYRQGRQQDALEVFQRVRRTLDADLGLRPSTLLQRLERDVLDQVDPAAFGAELLRSGTGAGITLAGPVSNPERPIRGSDLPFVGRARVLESLASLAAERGSSITVVEGGRGHGKSRLADEAAKLLEESGASVLRARCRGGVGIDPVPALLAAALDTLTARGTHVDDLSVLDALLPGRFGVSPVPDTDPELRRVRLHDAARQLLNRAAAVGTTVAIIDDLHGVEPTGAELLGMLVRDVPQVHWVFLTRRSDRTDACNRLLLDLRAPSWLEIGALTPVEVTDLVASVAPRARTTSWANLVIDRTGGVPFHATELVAHLANGGDEGDVPGSIVASVRATLGVISPDARAVATWLAAAYDTPLEHRTLATATGDDDARLDAALGALEAAGIVAVDEREKIVVRHELIADAMAEVLESRDLQRVHLVLARALDPPRPGEEPFVLEQLLAAGPLVTVDELDRAACHAIRRLSDQAALADGMRLGAAYLDVVGPLAGVSHSVSALEARVLVASVMLGAGEVRRGSALLDAVLPAVRAAGLPDLLADALLARGALALGAFNAAEMASEAVAVLDRIGGHDVHRRVSLGCWAAHHFANAGRAAEARAAVDASELDLGESDSPYLRSLVLSMRYQMTMLVDSPPGEARAAFDRLGAFAELSDDALSSVAHRLLALDQAVRHGTVDEWESAIDALEAIRDRLPRPDVRWWVPASRAAHAMATGRLHEAERLTQEASAIGGDERIELAPMTLMVHHGLLAYERDRFADLASWLPAVDEKATLVLVSAAGLVAALQKRSVDAARAATVLAEPGSLLRAGLLWPLVAVFGTDLAVELDDQSLAGELLRGLERAGDMGLGTMGLLHLGSTARCRGMAAGVVGDLDLAVEQLEHAAAVDEARGLPRWAGRAAEHAATARRRRGKPGDEVAALELESRGRLLLR